MKKCMLISSLMLTASLSAMPLSAPMRGTASSIDDEIPATPRGVVPVIDDGETPAASSLSEVSPDRVTGLVMAPDGKAFLVGRSDACFSSRQLRRYNALLNYLNKAIITEHYDFKTAMVGLITHWCANLHAVTNLPVLDTEVASWQAILSAGNLEKLVNFLSLYMPQNMQTANHIVAYWFISGHLDFGGDEPLASLFDSFMSSEPKSLFKRTMSSPDFPTQSFKDIDTRRVIDRLDGMSFSTAKNPRNRRISL